MASRFSSDSSVHLMNLIICVSDTMRRSFDRAHLDVPWGEAHLFRFVPISPNLWLCTGVSNGVLDPNEWYYTRVDGKWFGLGSPVAVWRDAIVISSSVPGRLLIVPDLLFGKPIPLRFRLQRVLMSPWLPSIPKKASSFYLPPFSFSFF